MVLRGHFTRIRGEVQALFVLFCVVKSGQGVIVIEIGCGQGGLGWIMRAPVFMSTYYLLDADSNTWSRKHVPLRAILEMPGVTDNHLLADAQTRQTLTVAEACAASRKARLKMSAADSLLKWKRVVPSASSGKSLSGKHSVGAVAQERKSARKREYLVVSGSDDCFGGRADAETLTLVLNSYARQGWKVQSCHLDHAPAAGMAWTQLLIILERGC